LPPVIIATQQPSTAFGIPWIASSRYEAIAGRRALAGHIYSSVRPPSLWSNLPPKMRSLES